MTETCINYFTEIEEHFRLVRGTPLFRLSSKDWVLIDDWKRGGIPLEAVLRGIDAVFEKWRRRRPGQARDQMVNSVAYCAQAIAAEAQAMANAQLENEGFWRDYAVALVQQAQGERSVADATLKDFIARDSTGGAFQIAVLYAIRKEPDEMFRWLETAHAAHDSGMVQLAITPFFLPYRDDPRFTALCQKLNVQLPATSAKR